MARAWRGSRRGLYLRTYYSILGVPWREKVCYNYDKWFRRLVVQDVWFSSRKSRVRLPPESPQGFVSAPIGDFLLDFEVERRALVIFVLVARKCVIMKVFDKLNY